MVERETTEETLRRMREMEATRLFAQVRRLYLKVDGEPDVLVTFTQRGDIYRVRALQNGHEMWGATSNVSAVDAYSQVPQQKRSEISSRLAEMDRQAIANRRKNG